MDSELSASSSMPNATGDPAPLAPRRIKALDQVVVNKIAAGEIIVAPVHALKELIENSVDAGSTAIEIVVKEGGLRLLQITDNGHGINREDMPILCERFTTSKLQSFEDLTSIGTYGFRGEALASISHIAHLTITTKTKESSNAWRAVYSDGNLIPPKPGQSAEPKPVAGKQGTQITVEDLFYNVPSRRRAFRSPGEEYSKILDVVGRYAVHCEGVSFSCKKHGDADMGVSTVASASISDRIRKVHGSAVANELIQFEISDKCLGFKAKGMLSNANYHVKKTTLLLFINHRSVESSSIKKGVEATYSTFLPKGGHPFAYLSVEIEPHRVDVNVHPTKREVNFLHEDEIVGKICEAIQEKLALVDTSRSYTLTQTLLPGAPSLQTPAKNTKSAGEDAGSGLVSRSRTKKPYENNTVRVDGRDRKITSMLQAKSQGCSSEGAAMDGDAAEYEYDSKSHWMLINYTTIKKLRAEVRDSVHSELSELFQNHTFVGVVDERRRLAAVQHGVKLYLIDYAAVSFELFYQIGLSDFANFGAIRLNPPLLLRDILQIAAKEEMNRADEDQDDVHMEGAEIDHHAFDWEGAILTIESLLINKKQMLQNYFSMEITDDGQLVTIPLLLKGYMPSLGKLPSFLLRLGPNVDWNSELECFDTFLRELAVFYVPEILPSPPAQLPPPPPPVPLQAQQQQQQQQQQQTPTTTEEEEANVQAEEDPAITKRRQELLRVVETLLFPAFRKRLIAPKSLLGSVTEVANLKGLYRIFERSC